MHRLLQYVSGALLTCLSLDAVGAAPGTDCRQASLDLLQAASPEGFAIYRQMRQPDVFRSWIDCDDAQFDLSTAVHESTHVIAAETDAFPLIGGGAIARPHEVSQFFPPSRIANRFKADDYTTIYLRLGKASSSTDFLYLLDELNAYAHDLAAAVDLKALTKPDEAVDHRDGLAALMAFVAVYAETAKAADARTWRGLQEPEVAKVVSRLWGQAERVMASSCGIPNFGSSDTYYIRKYCAVGAQSALEPILGRPPVYPAACLDPALDVEPTSALPRPSTDDRSIAGPAWIRAMIHSLSTSRQPDETPIEGYTR